jgi:drug/metabolite transporter (DMT)-like permease
MAESVPGPAAVRRPPTLAATLALLAATAAWGSTFVVVKNAIARMPVMEFLAWRFAIATVLLALVRPRAVARLARGGRRAGVVLGVALGAGYITQTLGLATTPASVSGFITGMFVVFTPLTAALLLRRPVGRTAWTAVAVATVGLALLSLHGFSLGWGELLTLACALAFALHIVGLGEWSTPADAVGLAVVQLSTVTVLCTACSGRGLLRPPPDDGVWVALALTAVAATAVAFLVQTWAQAHLAPTRAAIVMTMEPVFAGVFSVWLGGDRLGSRPLLGGALVLAAMLLVEIDPRAQTLGPSLGSSW